MTNYEYFKDEIIKEIARGGGFKLAVADGKLRNCIGFRCDTCDMNGCGNCAELRTAWLNAEHIEKPKLNKKERQFCELVETGWLCRNESGGLYYRPITNVPHKERGIWSGSDWGVGCDGLKNILGTDDGFSFITWDDEEPWSVEELLKLEVCDE